MYATRSTRLFHKIIHLGTNINDHLVPNIQPPDVFTEGEIWAHMTNLANLKAGYIHELKFELLKWATNDLVCEPITKQFNLVAKEGFTATWTINNIQMIFKYDEKHSLGNYRTNMLGTYFGKLYGSVLEKN